MATEPTKNETIEIPLKDALTRLGISQDALDLYFWNLNGSTIEETVDEDQVKKIEDVLHHKSSTLRLDELSRISLVLDWVAASQARVRSSLLISDLSLLRIDELVKDQQKQPSVESIVEPFESRMTQMEAKLDSFPKQNESGNAMGMIATLQTMIDSQARELDKLRKEHAQSQKSILQFQKQIDQLIGGLHSVIDGVSQSTKLKSNDVEPIEVASSVQEVESEPNLEPSVQIRNAVVETAVPGTSKVEAAETSATLPRFENIPPTKPEKINVMREIEFNFLLERMGFDRLDSYPKDFKGDVQIPSDEEIKRFLGKYELGCEIEEADIVTVQRGEYQMVQYKRIDKAGGLKGWMPSTKRK